MALYYSGMDCECFPHVIRALTTEPESPASQLPFDLIPYHFPKVVETGGNEVPVA